MTYRFLSIALKEIAEAADFYERECPGLGVEFIDELDTTIERMLQFPQAWGNLTATHRHCRLQRFPYSIIYTIEDSDSILVLSVFHHARDPSSWRELP